MDCQHGYSHDWLLNLDLHGHVMLEMSSRRFDCNKCPHMMSTSKTTVLLVALNMPTNCSTSFNLFPRVHTFLRKSPARVGLLTFQTTLFAVTLPCVAATGAHQFVLQTVALLDQHTACHGKIPIKPGMPQAASVCLYVHGEVP